MLDIVRMSQFIQAVVWVFCTQSRGYAGPKP